MATPARKSLKHSVRLEQMDHPVVIYKLQHVATVDYDPSGEHSMLAVAMQSIGQEMNANPMQENAERQVDTYEFHAWGCKFAVNVDITRSERGEGN